MIERSYVQQAVRRMSLCVLVGILVGFLPHKTTPLPFTPTSVEAQEPETPSTNKPQESATNGKLIFPAAYDQDGSALTNPQISDAVSIRRITAEGDLRVLDFTKLTLGIEVVPSNFWQNPAGTKVEVRIWNNELAIDHRVSAVADEWGAVELEVPFNPEQLTGIWMYQAAAEGFGETTIRSFQIDQSSVQSAIHYGGISPTYTIAEDGRLTIDIATKMPINTGLGQVQLELYRIKELDNNGTLGREMYPLVIGEATNDYHGQYQLYLDPGFYEAVAVIKSGVTEFRSAPLRFDMAEYAAPAPSLIESQAALEQGQVMVMYRTTADMLAIRTVDSTWIPNDIDVLEAPIIGTIAQRQRAFEHNLTTYSIKNQGFDTSLSAIEYDQTTRAYVLSFINGGLAFDTKIEVHVEQSDTVYFCDVQLDQTSCRIDNLTLPDEYSTLIVEVEQARIAEIEFHSKQTIYRRSGDKGFLGDIAQNLLEMATKDQAVAETVVVAQWEVHFALGLKFIEITFWETQSKCTYDRELECKTEEKDIGDIELPGDLLNGLQDYLFDKFNVREIEDLLGPDAFLDFGGFEIAIGTGIELTTKFGVCKENFDRAKAEKLVEYTGDKLRDLVSIFNQIFKKVREYEDTEAGVIIPIPFVTPLAVRLVPAVAMKLTASDSKEELSISLGFTGEVLFKMQLGITIASWGTYLRAPKAIWNMVMYTIVFLDLADLVMNAIEIQNTFAKETKKNDVCDPPPPPPSRNPDDRRDADSGFNSTLDPDTTSFDYIQSQIAKAEDLGLERAKAYWMLQLREREANQGFTDVAALTEYQTTLEAQQSVILEHMQGVISGTIPLSPGTTITETLDSLYGNFVDQMHEAPYQQTLNELVSERAFIQRRFDELVTGQELELQQELRQMEQGQGIGILDAGYAVRAYETLKRYGLDAVFVQITSGSGIVARSGLASREYSPYEAPPVLIVPSGALYNYQGLAHIRQWFEAYTASGGTLLVMTQAEGADWELLPGGEVRGLGYTEDILCISQSVEIINPSPWISGISRNKPDIQLDGSFTAWPNNANVILMRTTGNQMPAMLEYSYGAGSVVATSLYADFATFNIHTLEDKIFGLGFFNKAHLQATQGSLKSVVAPQQTVTLQMSVTNRMAQAVDSLTLWNNEYFYTALKNIDPVYLPTAFGSFTFPIDPPLQRGESRTMELSFSAPTTAGIYRASYVLGSEAAWAYSGIIPGPFYQVRPADEYISPVQFNLLKSASEYGYGETAVITASIKNLLQTEQVVDVRAVSGLEPQVTSLTLAPDETQVLTYTTTVFEQKRIKLVLERNNTNLSFQNIMLNLRPAKIGLVTDPTYIAPWNATTVGLTATLQDSQAETLEWRISDVTGHVFFTATDELSPTSSAIQSVEQTVLFPSAEIGDTFLIEAATDDESQHISQTLKVVAPVEVVSIQFPAALQMQETAVVTVFLQTREGFTGDISMQLNVLKYGYELATSSDVYTATLEEGLWSIAVELPIPTVLEASSYHSIELLGTATVDGLPTPIDLVFYKNLNFDPHVAVGSNFDAAATEPMQLELMAIPGNVLPPVTGTYTLTLQHAIYPETYTMAVTPTVDTPKALLFETPWPTFKYGGVYNILIESAHIPGWSGVTSLRVPPINWMYEQLPNVAAQAGEIVTVTLQHDWPLASSLSGTLSLLTYKGDSVAQALINQSVGVAESLELTFMIPERLSSGTYILEWQGSDHREFNNLKYQWIITVEGTIELAITTDQQVYYIGQAVSSTTALTTSVPLTNAWLRLETFLHSPPQTKTLEVIAGKRYRADGVGFEANPTFTTGALAISNDNQWMLIGDDTNGVTDSLVLRYVDLASRAVSTQIIPVLNTPGDVTDFKTNKLVLDPSNMIAYGVDRQTHIVYKINLLNSTAEIFAGGYHTIGSQDGIGLDARFEYLDGIDIAVDGSYLIVFDGLRVRKIDLTTAAVTTLRTFTYAEISAGYFNDLVIADANTAYLASPTEVIRFNLNDSSFELLAGGGFDQEGPGANIRFNMINGLDVDPGEQKLLIGDRQLIRQLELTAPYTVTTFAGTEGVYGPYDGALSETAFASISALRFWDNNSKVMLFDEDNLDLVRSIDLSNQSITTLLGPAVNVEGSAHQSNLYRVWYDMTYSSERASLLFGQSGYEASLLRELDLNLDTIENLAGDPYTTTTVVDGIGDQASLEAVQSLTVDPSGSFALFVSSNHVRRLDLQTQAVTTLAGSGSTPNPVNLPGDQVRFNSADGLVLNPSGNEAFLMDRYYIYSIQLTAPYTVTQVAGGEYTGSYPDGTGENARFYFAYRAVHIPGSQTLLMLDNSTLRTMSMDSPYTVATPVGVIGDNQCVDGFGSVARLNYPQDLTIDGLGLFAFVLDACGIRRINLRTYEVVTILDPSEIMLFHTSDYGDSPLFVESNDDGSVLYFGYDTAIAQLNLEQPKQQLRVDWVPVDGSGSFDVSTVLTDVLDANVEGHVSIQATLFDREPAGLDRELRYQLAAAETHFTVVDNQPLWMFSQQPIYRANLLETMLDDQESTIRLQGVIHNLSAVPATETLNLRRNGEIVETLIFEDLAPNQIQPWSYTDSVAVPGPVVYTAELQSGAIISTLLDVVSPQVDVAVSMQDSSIILGESSSLTIDLANQDAMPAVVELTAFGESQWLRLEPGMEQSFEYAVTPTATGTLSYVVMLDGDVQASFTPTLNVGEVFLDVEFFFPTVDSSTFVADPYSGVLLHVTSTHILDAVMQYEFVGPQEFEGQQTVTISPTFAGRFFSVPQLQTGLYSFTAQILDQESGTVLAVFERSFILVDPEFTVLADLQTQLDPQSGEAVLTLVVTNTLQSSGFADASILIDGLVDTEESIFIDRGESAYFTYTVDLKQYAGEQMLDVLVVQNEFEPAGESRRVIDSVAPPARILAHETFFIQAQPRLAPGIRLTALETVPATIGTSTTLNVLVDNAGVAGEGLFTIRAFDREYQVLKAVEGFTSTVIPLTFEVPDNLIAGLYPVAVLLGDQHVRAEVRLNGPDVLLAQFTDAPIYAPQSSATWTVELEGSTAEPRLYDVALRYHAEAFTQTVTLIQGQIVPVSWTFETGIETEYATVVVLEHQSDPDAAQYQLVIDTIKIEVQSLNTFWLATDKDRYQAGETVSLTLDVLEPVRSAVVFSPDQVNPFAQIPIWTSYEVSTTARISGTYSFTYTLPTVLPTGRYAFEVLINDTTYLFPIDVFGVQVQTDMFDVVPSTQQSGSMALDISMRVRSNKLLQDVYGLAYVIAPDGSRLDLGSEAFITTTLQADSQMLEVVGVFTPTLPGMYQVGFDMLSADGQVLGGSFSWLQLGSAHLVDFTTDHGVYSSGQTGQGALVVYGSDVAEVAVLAADGSLLLNQTVALTGYEQLFFAVPTSTPQRTVLTAVLTDALGMTDTLSLEYVVADWFDTTGPLVQIDTPIDGAHVVVEPGVRSITVTGSISDVSAISLFTINDLPVEIVNNRWEVAIPVELGLNSMTTYAVDEHGNQSLFPSSSVYIEPDLAVDLAVTPSSTTINGLVAYQSLITSTETITARLWFPFDTSQFTINDVSAATGVVSTTQGMLWTGQIGPNQPLEVAWNGSFASQGVYTQTVTLQGPSLVFRQSEPVTVTVDNATLVDYQVYLPRLSR